MKLDRPLTLPEPQLDPAAREEIERGDALGHPDRVIRGELDDAVAEPDAARPLAGRTQKDLGCRRVRVLLEEVVLDHPRIVVAEAVGQLDLREHVREQAALALVCPRPRQLRLVEDADLHRVPVTPSVSTTAERPSASLRMSPLFGSTVRVLPSWSTSSPFSRVT